jgi:manganese-dependent inorganic pyrophosphatase
MLYIIGHTKPDLDSAVAVAALKYLFDQAACFGYKKSVPVLAGPANFETQTIFKKFNTPLPQILKTSEIKADDRFILADHNEASQRLTGIKDEQIVDIYDHHKVNLNLSQPIFVNIKTWGATGTIASWFMEISNVRPNKNLASLMISAILSDTQGFKSSTTTPTDKNQVNKLNQIAQIKDLDDLTLEIFKAKSNLKGLSSKQILTKDYKLYDFSGKKVLINQLETVEQEKLLDQSIQLIKELKNVIRKMNLDHAVCVITDVLRINSKAFVSPQDENLFTQAFPQAKKIKNGVYDLGPLMSRKKEIAPAIEKAISAQS